MKTKNLKKRPTKASTRAKNKKTKNSVTFLSIARSYLNNRVVTKSYASNVIKVAKDVKFLTTESVNNYLKKRLETIQASTVRSHRTILLGLWKYAYENDLIDHMPKNIIKIKIKRKPTKAWTIKDCEDLVQKTFVKWDGETVPSSVQNLNTKSGPYSYNEMLEILSGPEWTSPATVE